MKKIVLITSFLSIAVCALYGMQRGDRINPHEQRIVEEMYAYVMQNDLKSLRRTLRQYPHLINEPLEDGWTLLHQAANDGRDGICRFLIRKGAHKHLVNEDWKTPADLAQEEGYEGLALYLDPAQHA